MVGHASIQSNSKGDIKISKTNLCAGTQFQINRLLPYLEIYAEEYLLTKLNKIIVKILPFMAQQKYLKPIS